MDSYIDVSLTLFNISLSSIDKVRQGSLEQEKHCNLEMCLKEMYRQQFMLLKLLNFPLHITFTQMVQATSVLIITTHSCALLINL